MIQEQNFSETFQQNPRLIAKAPEMYALLNQILQDCYCDYQRLSIIEQLIKEIDNE